MSLPVVTLCAAFAAAAPLKVVIVPIGTASEPSGVASVVQLIGDVVEDHHGLRSSTVDELHSVEGTALSRAIERCGADDSCVRGHVRTYGADLGLTVLLNRSVKPAILELTLLSARAETGERFVEVADLPSTDLEAAMIRDKAQRLLARAGYRFAARITIKVDPVDATIVLDDVPSAGVTQSNLFRVAPGPHRIELKRAGYDPQSHERTLEPGEAWAVDAKLVEQRSLVQSPYFWAAVGVGAAVVGVATFLLVRPSSGLCLTDPQGAGGSC